MEVAMRKPERFNLELDDAIRRCVGAGLDLDVRWTERGLEIPYVELSEGLPKGTGLGSAALYHVLEVADAQGIDVMVPPVSAESIRFFGRHGFAWPSPEVVCDETDLLMMVRPHVPKPELTPPSLP